MHQILCRQGFAPNLTGELTASPRPRAAFRGLLLREGGVGNGREKKGRGEREEKERREKRGGREGR